MKKHAILIIIGLTATFANAQFPIKIPKIKVPKVEQPKTESTPRPSDNPTQTNQPNNPVEKMPTKVSVSQYDRQMVMDDGFTYFDAEHKNKSASNSLKDQDVGWYMKSSLRLLGTFPERSAFRVVVKKNGKQLTSVRCEGQNKTKANDDRNRTNPVRQAYSLNYDDYMETGFNCYNEDAISKETGKLDVEIYFINGDTDEEKLVRTYKIDVHRATNVRGNAVKPEQDVPSYYIQRHAEEAVAFAHFDYAGSYFKNPVERYNGSSVPRILRIYTTYSPQSQKYFPNVMFTRCTVNGQKINFPNMGKRDSVSVSTGGRGDEIGSYTDRLIPQYQRGNPYVDKVLFQYANYTLPIYTGGDVPSSDYLKIEDHPGNWECTVISNGETYRTFRWKVSNGKIVPLAEQTSGNVNLFYDAALIEIEIPAGGSPNDYRLMPMPEMGLFYGIPWKTAEGKSMAARVPKVGNPYPVPSNQAN